MRAWVVELIKPIGRWQDPWPIGYFPRKFYYYRDALRLKEEVAKRGGEAQIVREEKEKS
jgi:hypothetical protein